MAVVKNEGGGTTQAGYGTHGDRRTKRTRTRGTQKSAALAEWLGDDPDLDCDTANSVRK